MLTLDQCIKANRPLIFVVAESDLEVLLYIDDKFKDGNFSIYSKTLANIINLRSLLDKKFTSKPSKALSTVDILDKILSIDFYSSNKTFETYIFLDSQDYIHDKQIIRKIKDILFRYQIDPTYTVNLIFIFQIISVPPSLERLSEMVFFDLPDIDQLKEQSDKISSELELKGKKKPNEEIVNNLKGLTKFEVEQAYLQSFTIYEKVDIKFIRDFKKNAIAKTDLLSLLESNINFNEIGGMEKLKKWIQKSYGGWTVEGRDFGLPILKGLLLVGLPGCGKSLICKAIGNEWNLPVVQLDPSRIFSSRVGDSEANMRRVLKIIENISPCVLFVDEMEKGFAGMHSSTFSDAGVTARVIGSFLIWLQECQAPIFTIATSNNIQYLPPELISRFDETFFVNLPQFKERIEIFRIHLRKLKKDPDKFHLEVLAQNSKDLSGREIEQALKEAMYNAFYSKKNLTTDIIINTLNKKTNLLTTMAEQLNYILKWVGWDEDKKDGIRARYANPVEPEEVNRVQDEVEKLIKDIENGEGPVQNGSI